ncbi:MAG: hypothetical protein JO153_18520 [Solirubrobacterales bacterium]|nr:hypothetical protein [Solirubrobacterales bacterium]MBV9918499.1 hypothetical protein [Solirubrobacterales bacterium]
MHATLVGENHAPKVGQEWRYTVRATDASGRPLTGTVETEFALGGQVVGRETPATHPLRHGVLHDSIQFPAQAVGYPLALRAVVRSTAGTVAVDWRVTVSR